MRRRLLTSITVLLVLLPLGTTAFAGAPGNAPGQSAPTKTSDPTISGKAIQGETLTASAGSWSGPSPTYAYQWNGCDSSGASCTLLAGATASTYLLGAGSVGSTLRVTVTATSKNGSTVVSSAPSAVVASTTATTTTTTTTTTTSTTATTTTTSTTPTTTTTSTTPTTTTSTADSPYLLWTGASLPGPWTNDAPLSTDPTFSTYAYLIAAGADGQATRLKIDSKGGALTSGGIKTTLQENRVYSNTDVGKETWYRAVFRFPAGHYFPTSGDFNVHEQWHSNAILVGTGSWNTFVGVRCGSSPGVDCRLILVRRAGVMSASFPYTPAIEQGEDVFAPNSLLYDHWYDSLLRIKWYPDSRGSISWYVDGVLKYQNLSTPTLLQSSTGSVDHPAFDISNYRRNDVTTESWTDFDLAAIGPSRASVGG
jgi:hypothetical protein